MRGDEPLALFRAGGLSPAEEQLATDCAYSGRRCEGTLEAVGTESPRGDGAKVAEVKEKFGLSSVSQDCSGVSGEGLSMASSLGERLIFLFFEEDVLATSCKNAAPVSVIGWPVGKQNKGGLSLLPLGERMFPNGNPEYSSSKTLAEGRWWGCQVVSVPGRRTT